MTLTGLLGGSFNPAHDGHRRISLAALDALGLDEIWWLVSPGNPLKPAKGMAPLPARFASARRAARRARIRATAIESELGTIYTVDTLAALTRRYPGPALHLADGNRQSRPVPPLARLAEDRSHHADCGRDSARL